MCIDGAIAVTSYSSANAKLPIEIGIATGTNTLNVVIGVVPGVIEIHSGDEVKAGLSALEMEAIGLQPTRACELINDFLIGGVVGCREARVKVALQQLYKIAGHHMEFQLEELGDLDISPPTFDQGACAEMEARRLVFLARQSKSRGASHVRH
ncbi:MULTISPECIES: hypothetical protein [unclassified Pseudomonas]|uniref:hypothetical protein n=1 Tax=unclassified Pseudomonas TaxID=196821 RepID=UPI00190E5058|nr:MULTISPECIES: hypothetical protein [unclassified Pseudomonas]MBK3468465.1 hypothetical protein [Pseudomonas sp. MF6776]